MVRPVNKKKRGSRSPSHPKNDDIICRSGADAANTLAIMTSPGTKNPLKDMYNFVKRAARSGFEPAAYSHERCH